MHSLSILVAGLPLLPSAAPTSRTIQKRDVEIPYGPIIEHCNVPGVVALTFDDGPHIYTAQVLDILDQYGAKATFFVNGDNFGHGFIDDPTTPWPGLLHRMIDSGHQVGSHTWDHLPDLSFTDTARRHEEMDRLEEALTSVLGFYPTYMRPPFASCDAACQEDMGEMGYHVVNFDVDTKDYAHDSPDQIDLSMDVFDAAVTGDPAATSYLVLSHDSRESTAEFLVEYMLQTLQQRGYKAVPVGECLGDAPSNWYRANGEE